MNQKVSLTVLGKFIANYIALSLTHYQNLSQKSGRPILLTNALDIRHAYFMSHPNLLDSLPAFDSLQQINK